MTRATLQDLAKVKQHGYTIRKERFFTGAKADYVPNRRLNMTDTPTPWGETCPHRSASDVRGGLDPLCPYCRATAEQVQPFITTEGWTLTGPKGYELMIGGHGHVAPTQWEAVAEALRRIEQDERLETTWP